MNYAARCALPIAVVFALAGYAAATPQPAAAAETRFLAIWAFAVLAPLALLTAGSSGFRAGSTAVLALAATAVGVLAWTLPAGPTRGAATGLVLVLAVGLVAVAGWPTWRRAPRWTTLLLLALATQALLRADLLLPAALSLPRGIQFVGPPILGVSALLQFTGRWPLCRLLIPVGAVLSLAQGWTPAVAAALAVSATVEAGRDGIRQPFAAARRMLGPLVLLLGALLLAGSLRLAAFAFAVLLLLGAVAALRGVRAIVARPLVPVVALLALVWVAEGVVAAGIVTSWLPVRAWDAAGASSLWLLILLPFLCLWLRRSSGWIYPMLTAWLLALLALRWVSDPAALAFAVLALSLAESTPAETPSLVDRPEDCDGSSRHDRPHRLQLAWTLSTLLAVALLAGYPWLRPPITSAVPSVPHWLAGGVHGPSVVLQDDVQLSAEQPVWKISLETAMSVGSVTLDTHLANSLGLTAGTPVAEIYLGAERVGELHAGRDTGEWAARRPDVARQQPVVPVLWQARVTASGTFFAQCYRARLARLEPGPVRRLEVRRHPALPPEVVVTLMRVELWP